MTQQAILFLAANPQTTSDPRLAVERAAIERELKMSPHRDDFEFKWRHAFNIDELIRLIAELEPTVIHFSGRGEGDPGLAFVDRSGRREVASAPTLAKIIGATASRPRLVVLNTCYTPAQAEILRAHVDCVVGTARAISEHAVHAFAMQLYGELGRRRSVGIAVEQAVAVFAAMQMPNEALPRCVTRHGVDAYQVFLNSNPDSDPGRTPELPGVVQHRDADLDSMRPPSLYPRSRSEHDRRQTTFSSARVYPERVSSLARDELLTQLSKLLPSQFDEVLFRVGIPVTYLPGPSSSQMTRAIDLLRYAEQQERLESLARVIEEIHGSGMMGVPGTASDDRPTPASAPPGPEVRALSERLEAARTRKDALRAAGEKTGEVDGEILELRRELREGMQLRVGAFLGGGRYLLIKRLGRGGFAVVWEASDRSTQRRVAIKVLHPHFAGEEQRRERFFRGARVMAGLTHPAIVRVLDPCGEDDAFSYFVMELVPGGNLREAVLAGRVTAPRALDLILQVGQALAEAHRQQLVHRDVKPANILLDEQSDAKLTDFDLVGAHDTTGGTRTGALGTVIYAAPECLDKPQEATARVDVFGLGMTAIFCLTGHDLPTSTFRDPTATLAKLHCSPSVRQVLARAIAWEPAERYADAAAMVDALRGALEPAERIADPVRAEPSQADGNAEQSRAVVEGATMAASDPPSVAGARLLGAPRAWVRDRSAATAAELPHSNGEAAKLTSSAQRLLEGELIGRADELAALHVAFAQLVTKGASVIVLRSPPGMGKTALAVRFLAQLRVTHPSALVLRGRCDQDDGSRRAADQLINELGDWWAELPPNEAQVLLPRDASLLPTLFPVLNRVPLIANTPNTHVVTDPQTRRTHAFAALRETFQRLANMHATVLFIDDMQWADRGTMILLSELMRAPDPPAVLVVLATRSDGSEPVVSLVRRMDVAQQLIELPPLPENAALAIAVSQLSDETRESAPQLVNDAGGNPRLLLELALCFRDRASEQILGKSLATRLIERLNRLPESARRIAEYLAVAGGSISRTTLASIIEASDVDVSLLSEQFILNISIINKETTLELSNSGVRDALLRELPVERSSALHRVLATALSNQGTEEQLAHHWYCGGDLEQAAIHAMHAGNDANARLDYDLASRWYSMALKGPQWTESERHSIHAQLADVLSDAGRPDEAAEQLLIAGSTANAVGSLELRRRAASFLLRSGHVTEGLQLVRTVLANVGLAMTSTPLRGLIRAAFRRVWVRIRGLGFRRRALAQISQLELTRVDVCEDIAFGLTLVDTFRSMDFVTLFLLSALRLGESWRVSRALALEIDWLAASGKSVRAIRLLERLRKITPNLREPEAPVQLAVTNGYVDFFVHSKFRRTLVTFDAIANYFTVVTRTQFELDVLSVFCCWSLYYLGELAELSRRVPALAEAATRNGSRYTAAMLRCAFPMAWIARCEPDAVENQLSSAFDSLEEVTGGYQLLHLFALASRIDVALYLSRPEDVTSRIAAEWKQIRRSLVDRLPLQGLVFHSAILRYAVACANRAAPGSSRRRDALGQARSQLRRLPRRLLPVIGGSAMMFEGLIAESEGHSENAVELYRGALIRLEQCETYLYAYAIRDRLGRLIGGDEGARLRGEAQRWLAGESVREPKRVLAMLLPGPHHS